jgi:hypothetical protein
MTTVGIDGERFRIGGRPTYEGLTFEGTDIEGRLFNSRMVHALFDDENPETRDRWAYPDTGEFDADRNVAEFLAALPTYYDHGLRAVTINLQCGSPEGYSDEQPWRVSAFRPDGTLKRAWTDRLRRVLARTDDLGMVVIVGLFYFGQDDVFADRGAVENAVDNAAGWLADSRFENVVVEIANECDLPEYDHEVIRPPGVVSLVERAQEQVEAPVGTSFSGGAVPPDEVVAASDVVLLHGNGVENPDRIRGMVAEVRGLPSYEPMPILFNEDDHFCFGSDCNMLAAVESGASWGYFDPGESNYRDGYQCPPVEWSINTPRKRAFFGYLPG